jgi:trigger factor
VEHVLTSLDGCKREVKISLSTSELTPHYNNAYERARGGISLPGFRKGKVPTSIIKQKFGREIEAEALETIADEEFRSYATAENLRVVGHPALTDLDKTPDGVTFTVAFEVMPEIELGDYRGLVVNRPVREVSEHDVEEEIDRIRLRAATFEPAEQVTDNQHVVTITLRELDKESGVPVIGAEPQEEKVYIDDDQVDMHLRNSLMDKKVGDSFSYVGETADENTQPPSFQVTVSDIQRVVPAELTNDFAETITGGAITSTEALREDILKQLTAYFDQAGRNAVENQIVDQLVKAHDFAVPASLVHSVVHQLFDDFKKRNEGAPGLENLTAHDVEDEFKPMAERIAKWELLRSKIIETEEIELSDEDVRSASERYGVTEEQLRMVMRQNRQIEDQILAEKVMNVLIDYAVVNDVTADPEETVV